jgi:histidinol-phosphate/aromatic aminotransferase/cobyric acid decarboxylase-like protein
VLNLALKLFDPEVRKRQELLLREIANNKRALLDGLDGRAFVKDIWPGEANFVLLRVSDAAALVSHCARSGITIRAFRDAQGLEDCVRVTVGSSQEIEALVAALDAFSTATESIVGSTSDAQA